MRTRRLSTYLNRIFDSTKRYRQELMLLGPFLSVENLAILPRFSKNFADKLICLCHIVAKMARILPFMAIFATDGKNLAIFATIWQA